MRYKDIHKTYNLRLSGDGSDTLEHSIRCGYTRMTQKVIEKDFLTSQYALVYVEEGEGSYRDREGKEWPLREGTLFQRFPDTPHTVRFQGHHSHYYLAVPPQIFGLLEKVGSPFIKEPVHYPGKDSGAAAEYRKLLTLFENRDESEYFTLLIEMQGALNRLIKLNERQLSGVAGKLEEAAEILRNISENDLTLQEIAFTVNMGYHHFRKAFKERYGQSPGQYRKVKRVESAMGLLMTPGYSITRIARELKYPDVYTFSAQFKRVCSLSPSHYRKGHSGVQ